MYEVTLDENYDGVCLYENIKYLYGKLELMWISNIYIDNQNLWT